MSHTTRRLDTADWTLIAAGLEWFDVRNVGNGECYYVYSATTPAEPEDPNQVPAYHVLLEGERLTRTLHDGPLYMRAALGIQRVSVLKATYTRAHFARRLDTNGDGTGTKDALGDYSSAQEIFFIQPPAGEIYDLARILIGIQDTGAMRAEGYGSDAAPLANGVALRVQDDAGTLMTLADPNIKANGGWAFLCYDAQVLTWGVGDEMLAARYTFTKFGGVIRLRGDNNERLEVVLNDDFSAGGQGLVHHYFTVEGQSYS
jgi:hypothetical protein